LLLCVAFAGGAEQAAAAVRPGTLIDAPAPWSTQPLTESRSASPRSAGAGFEVNRGQFPRDVLFADHRASAITYFTPSGPLVVDGGRVMRLRFEGGRRTFAVHGEGASAAVTNYFVGNDPSRWRRNVPSVATVRYDDVWPGVDVRFRHADGELEYDLLLDAGVTRTSFPIHLSGADGIRHGDDGDLQVALGGSTLRKHALHGWEERASGRRPVPVSFQIRGRDRISIELGDHDPTVPVVIDPILTYSTYLGGSGSDTGRAVVADPSGDVFVVSETSSDDFPAAGATDSAMGDVVISRLGSGGQVMYTSFFGGSSLDTPVAATLGEGGKLYVLGGSESDDLPVSDNATQPRLAGPADVFLARFDASSGQPDFVTYFGGTQEGEIPEAVAVGRGGTAYFTGYTYTSDLPTTTAPNKRNHLPTSLRTPTVSSRPSTRAKVGWSTPRTLAVLERTGSMRSRSTPPARPGSLAARMARGIRRHPVLLSRASGGRTTRS
jgi:Beta-propeller repeat